MKKPLATVLALSLLVPLAACKRQKAPMTPTPPEWLDTAVLEQVQPAAPNAVQVGSMYKGTAFREDDKQQWQVALENTKCYWISGAGDQTVEEIYLNLWNPNGDRVAKQKNGSPRTVLAYCPKMSGMFKFEAKITNGHGHYAVGIYADQAPEAAPEPEPPPEPAGPDLGAEIDEMAKSTAAGAERVGDFFAGEEDTTDWYVALETGKCYWFIGAGDDGVSELYLYLWDPQDSRITQNKSENNRVSVGHCPTSSGMYHFQAKVNSGSGQYKVGVYAKAK